MILALLVAIATSPFTWSPAKPTVGDPITIRAGGAPFEVRPSPSLEVVSSAPGEVVVRSFTPGTLRVEYALHPPGEVPAIGTLEIEVASVLAKDDTLEPAPLRPPKPLPRENTWIIATAAAAAIAGLLWALLALLVRRRKPVVPELPRAEDPDAAYRAALARVAAPGEEAARWVELSTATRRYLAATDPALGAELTSFELLGAMRRAGRPAPDVATVEAILRGGDWTKFSPFGAPRASIDDVVRDAARLLPRPAQPEAAA